MVSLNCWSLLRSFYLRYRQVRGLWGKTWLLSRNAGWRRECNKCYKRNSDFDPKVHYLFCSDRRLDGTEVMWSIWVFLMWGKSCFVVWFDLIFSTPYEKLEKRLCRSCDPTQNQRKLDLSHQPVHKISSFLTSKSPGQPGLCDIIQNSMGYPKWYTNNICSTLSTNYLPFYITTTRISCCIWKNSKFCFPFETFIDRIEMICCRYVCFIFDEKQYSDIEETRQSFLFVHLKMFLVVSTLFGHILKQVQLGGVIFTLECPARLHLSLKSLFVSVNEYHFPLIHAICENSSSLQQLLSCNQLRHKTSNITHIVQILVAPFSFKDWWSLEEPDCPGIERPHSVHSKSLLDRCHKPFKNANENHISLKEMIVTNR